VSSRKNGWPGEHDICSERFDAQQKPRRYQLCNLCAPNTFKKVVGVRIHLNRPEVVRIGRVYGGRAVIAPPAGFIALEGFIESMIAECARLEEYPVPERGHAVDGLADHRVTTDECIDAAPVKCNDDNSVRIHRNGREKKV